MASKLTRTFIRYVSQNILGMLGVSAYILADTYFISQMEGASGIAALNLVLPVYGLIYALGALLGTGGATRFALERHGNRVEPHRYLSEAALWAAVLSVPFMLLGLLTPEGVVRLMGGEAEIVAVGAPYTRVFLLFTPFFMGNYILSAFVRNDGDPALAMTATLSSSLFNIVMDWVLMYPCGLGMVGAALATAASPVVGMSINSLHFLRRRNTLRFLRPRFSIRLLAHMSVVGISAFIGEMASGVTTLVLNFLILGLAGSLGVAAYGVVANVAIVVTAIFTGISQGAQPLLSDHYGRGDLLGGQRVFRMSIATSLLLALCTVAVTLLCAEPIVAVFNSEQDPVMGKMAVTGMRLYFLGYLAAGFTIAATGYLSAVGEARAAMITSLLRGIGAIIGCAVVMAKLWGMTGVWLSFPAAEGLTAAVILFILSRKRKERPA